MLLVELSGMWWETDEYGDVLVSDGCGNCGGICGMVDCWGRGEGEMVVGGRRWVGK